MTGDERAIHLVVAAWTHDLFEPDERFDFEYRMDVDDLPVPPPEGDACSRATSTRRAPISLLAGLTAAVLLRRRRRPKGTR